MKKQILGIILVFGLISCTKNINGVIFISAYNTCSSVNYSDKKISQINILDNVLNNELLEDPNYVNQEVYPIKGDKSITTYLYNSSILAGKIFNKDKEIVIPLFKVIDSANKPLKYKIITDNTIDYFLVIYSAKNNYEKGNAFMKKFDFNGNQLGEEIKLSSNISIDIIEDVNYSFDKNGKNLILAWTNFSFAYKETHKCPSGIFGLGFCKVPAIVLPSYYHPVLNYIRFDEKLNYCFNNVSFDDLVSSREINFDNIPNQSSLKKYYSPYITKDHEKIILPINYNTSKELSLKDNVVKNG